MDIWVIGNGESRRGFALNQIKDHTIGCNAVHRDHLCTEYVAVDRRMVQEILRNNATENRVVYTRPDWAKEYVIDRVKILPNPPFTGKLKADQPFHWNSGPYAILLAALYKPKKINLLGFDLYSSNNLVNNIYKDTIHYSKSDARPVSPEHWKHQLCNLFNYFSEIEFIQHQLPNWQNPLEWKDIKNLTIKYIIV